MPEDETRERGAVESIVDKLKRLSQRYSAIEFHGDGYLGRIRSTSYSESGELLYTPAGELLDSALNVIAGPFDVIHPRRGAGESPGEAVFTVSHYLGFLPDEEGVEREHMKETELNSRGEELGKRTFHFGPPLSLYERLGGIGDFLGRRTSGCRGNRPLPQ